MMLILFNLLAIICCILEIQAGYARLFYLIMGIINLIVLILNIKTMKEEMNENSKDRASKRG